MSDEIPIWLLAGVFVLIIAGKFLLRIVDVFLFQPTKKQQRKSWRNYSTRQRSAPGKKSAFERALQGEFSRKPLFNKSELKIFNLLKEEIANSEYPYHVMGQAALPEILRTDSKFKKGGTYYAISSRRLDFVVIDQYANVVFVVEYNGAGHYQGNYIERDQIKSIVLHKAGIPLFVIEARDAENDIRRRIRTQFLAQTDATSRSTGDCELSGGISALGS